MRPFAKHRRGDALFLFEESGELPGIFELEAVGYFRNIEVAAGEQFLCFQEFLLQLVLGGRDACIFFEHAAEPGVTEAQAGRDFFRRQRVFHLLFHQDARLVDLIHHVGIREGIVSSFIIDRTQYMEDDARNHLLVACLFLRSEFQDVFIQPDDRCAQPYVL